MSCSEAQKNRLAAEKTVLDHFFPRCVKWTDPTGDTTVEVRLRTNNDNQYTLRIYIGYFPNSVPDMFVVSPPEPMLDLEIKAENHALGKRHGHLKIFHHNTIPSSLYAVVMKGWVWLEAYEGHLKTGEDISDLLSDMDSNGKSCASSPDYWLPANRIATVAAYVDETMINNFT